MFINKENRVFSFFVLTFIYALEIIIFYKVFTLLQFNLYLNIFIADCIGTLVIYFFSILLKNASCYDPYWSVQPVVIVACLSCKYVINSYTLLMVGVIFFWGIRLTLNWAYTFKNLSTQDWRYTLLKEKTKAFYPLINFFGIHFVPTIIVYLCVSPAIYAVFNVLEPNFLSFLFLFISICAVFIQGIADIQMHKFRKNGKTGFIRYGVWKYGRHPNYLGEILMWWGIGLSVFITDYSLWYLLTGALINTLLFLCASIPLSDEHQRRKMGFEDYKKQTRLFI